MYCPFVESIDIYEKKMQIYNVTGIVSVVYGYVEYLFNTSNHN